MSLIAGPTIKEVWDEVIGLYRDGTARRSATRFGISFDVAGLLLEVGNPADVTLPVEFRYPQHVTDYVERLGATDEAASLLHRRLRQWPNGRKTIDQLEAVERVLLEDETSRGAAFGLWNASEDLSSGRPVSPVAGGFRIVDEELRLFLVARSVDVLVGLVPELVAFARVQQDLANRLSVRIGPLHYTAWSAHMYESDYVAYVRGDA
jgi:thymidylate synthase